MIALIRRFRAWCRLGASWRVAALLAWHGAAPIAGGASTDPSVFNNPPGTASNTSTIIPQFTAQATTVNLANNGTINFDFNADTGPVFDLFVFADQPITVNIFIRQSGTDTYRLLNNAAFFTTVASVLARALKGERLPGSNVRVQLQNLSGAATTVISAQVHSRSI